MTRWLVAGAITLATLSGCSSRQRTPTEVSGQRTPPIPLSGDDHVEPDLVGTTHVVQKGETLYRIAKTYGIDPRELMEANGITDSRSISAGQQLFVPGAARSLDVGPLPPGATAALEPEVAPRKGGNGSLQWPLKGVLYRGFGVKQGQRHDGIDLSAPEGTLVHAAASGEVIYTGNQAGYGTIVILRHSGSLITLYAHNSAVLVKEGDRVAAGTPVAKVGQSGRTTGPHLHFEVREGTRPRDPLTFLP
ncbi:MAG: peptidoglycan DD-metalloendopeptidase family protein [Deltaproteobacteria bacterium]